MSNEKTQWKLVPYEPTQGMIYSVRRLDPALPLEHIRALWWSMWGAAPGAPSAEVVPKTRFTADQREHQRVIQGVDKWLSAYNLPTYSALATPAPEVPADRAALVEFADAIEHSMPSGAWVAPSFDAHRAVRVLRAAAHAVGTTEHPLDTGMVTLDSALRALDHIGLYNGPGRRAEAARMLASAPEAPGTQDGEALTSPFQPGRFKAWKQDINDLHSPWFLVVPGGDSFPFNHNADDAVDCARAMWVAAACNAYAARITQPEA